MKIKEMACSTLKITNIDTWENSLNRALTANAFEHINFLRPAEGSRVLFMPHSPGIYIALVLKNAEDIETENILSSKDLNVSESSSFKNSVQRLLIKNNLFLDIDSLSKNL